MIDVPKSQATPPGVGAHKAQGDGDVVRVGKQRLWNEVLTNPGMARFAKDVIWAFGRPDAIEVQINGNEKLRWEYGYID